MERKTPIEISVVIPILNEKDILPELYEGLVKSVEFLTKDYEFIFVDDGSKDNSLEILRQYGELNARVRYISFSRNFGHQIAIMAGIEHSSGNAVVIIDGDLQDPPELIPALYAEYRKGFKVVYAKRTKRKNELFYKKVAAKLFYRLLKRITAIDIPLDTGDFRIIDRDIAEHLKRMPEQSKFLRGQIAWLGFSQTFVEYERDPRTTGTRGYTFRKQVRLGIDGITSFSEMPLKMVSKLGFFVSGVAFLITLYALYSHFYLNRIISGWTSIMVSTMFIGGVQLLSIGIIGEYISRIHDNVKKRPLYIIDKTNLPVKE